MTYLRNIGVYNAIDVIQDGAEKVHKFPVPEMAGNSNASVTKESAVPFFSPLPQFPLGSFACSSLAELVFVFHSPPQLTEKGQLTV